MERVIIIEMLLLIINVVDALEIILGVLLLLLEIQRLSKVRFRVMLLNFHLSRRKQVELLLLNWLLLHLVLIRREEAFRPLVTQGPEFRVVFENLLSISSY